LRGAHGEQALAELLKRAEAGIYLWAVDSMQVIGGPQEQIDRYFAQAVLANLRSERFRAVVARAKPRLHALDEALARELLECGIEFLEKEQAHDAIVYFELLERSGCHARELPALLSESRRQAVHLQDD